MKTLALVITVYFVAFAVLLIIIKIYKK